MKKRLLLLLLTGLLAVPQVLAADYDYDFSAVCESGQTLYYKIQDIVNHYVAIVRGPEPVGNMIIPATVKYDNVSYTVIGISSGMGAFVNCTELTSVEIPSSVTMIGSSSFYGCKNLKRVIIHAGVKCIERRAFNNCENLTDISIPNSVTEIGYEIFSESPNISSPVYNDTYFFYLPRTYKGSYHIPDGIKTITDDAFAKCKDLKSVIIPNSVTRIYDDAFANCTNLETVQMSTNVLDGPDKSNFFSGCDKLKEPIFNQSVFFKMPISYNGAYRVPEGIQEIANYAFQGCKGLTSVEIPSSVNSIGSSAFVGCINLYNIDIQDGVSNIDAGTFSGCYNLKSVSFPCSVNYIGTRAFYGCINLASITISLFTEVNNKYSPSEFCPETTFFQYHEIKPNLISDSSLECSFRILEPTPKEITEKGIYYNTTYIKASDNKTIINNMPIKEDVQIFPYYKYKITTFSSSTVTQTIPIKFNTNSWLHPSISLQKIFSTSLQLIHSYDKGKTEIDSVEYVVQEIQNNKIVSFNANNNTLIGLKPNTQYQLDFIINIKNSVGNKVSTTMTTAPLILKTLNPKVSEGKVVVCAETNISDYETNVGFEWRKYDAPSTLPSKSGQASIYNGGMKGTIKNLATDAYWNVRAYYTANDGTSYYGDWVTFDPSDFSWFEPEVHTYPATIVPNQPPQLRGYAVEGSDDVEEQGFEYWPKMPSTRSTEPEGIKRIPATGTVMQASITDYEYSTKYVCRSYVVTATKTYYGEEQTFTTPEDPRPLYTFIVQAGENGRVNDDVNGQYREGESVEISATPSQGYKFTQWSDLMTENPRTVTVTQDTTIVASFDEIEDSTPDILADPDKTGVQVSDVLGRLHKVHNWNNLKGELRRGLYILFKGNDSQKILVE